MYHYQHSWPNFADTLSRVKTHWLPCFPTCFPPAIVHCVPHSIGYRHLICHYRLSLYWQTSLMLLSSPFPTATTGFPLPSKPHAPLSSLSPMSIIWDPPPQSSTYVANTPPPFTIFTTQVATISRSTTVGILPFCHTPWALSSYPLANAYHCQIHHHHLPFPLENLLTFISPLLSAYHEHIATIGFPREPSHSFANTSLLYLQWPSTFLLS